MSLSYKPLAHQSERRIPRAASHIIPMKNGSTKVSISMPADLYASANDRRLSLRYRSFSSYVQYLVEQDIDTGGSHVRVPISKDAKKAA